MAHRIPILLTSTLGLLISACDRNQADKTLKLNQEQVSQAIDFNRDIRPILNKNCTGCHGGVKMAGDVSFIYQHLALGKGKSGKTVISAGDPSNSEIMRRILTEDHDDLMPPPEHGPRLKNHEVALIKQWIEEGAKWDTHWSFESLKPIQAPQVSSDWGNGKIDQFVLAQLENLGFSPAPRAEAAELLRRVSFDLTGLPPTLAELDHFEQEFAKNPLQAYEQEVDRLLAAPSFGERWAAVWMDLARYADSEGLGLDRKRDVWPYRDWLIKSLNEDMPFDQFTIKQLAGDLLENPSYEDRIATVFHRLTQSNEEGGTDDEEFRITAVMDRVNTTWEVWQGQTFGCVQCHSHPYDTFEHEDYYNFMAFFNNDQDADLSNHFPTLKVPSEKELYPEAEGLLAAYRISESNYHGSALAIANKTTWKGLSSSSVNSQRSKSKVVKTAAGDEIHTVGNVAVGTQFDTTWQPTGESVQAIRYTMLPKAPEKAKSFGENGMVLSYVELKLTHAGKTTMVPLKHIIPDSYDGTQYARDSLNVKSKSGFGPLSKIFHPRSAILIPEKPVEIPTGATLTLHTRHNLQYLAAFVMVPHRFTIETSQDKDWAVWARAAEDQLAEFTKAGYEYRKISGPSIPIMATRDPKIQRITHFFERGNWLEKGKVIENANTPIAFPPLESQGAPANRLDLARWIVSKDNPLTARTTVNRYWHQFFGRGIVETLEDLGSSGTLPSHQDLLDDLAFRFQNDYQWSRKAIMREIVLSETYQQTAKVSADKRKLDPANQWLSYGSRRRLRAEAVRDAGLTVSGLLHHQLYGHPSYPPIPAGVWNSFSSKDKWKTPKKGDPQRYRRALYTYWKRSLPYPALMSFDTPSRELCSKRRLVSNTPTAALTTLNDPSFSEFAQALGLRMQNESQDSLSDKLAFGYRLATSQQPPQPVLDELKKSHEDILSMYTKSPDLLKKSKQSAESAAFSATASLILNLDAALTK